MISNFKTCVKPKNVITFYSLTFKWAKPNTCYNEHKQINKVKL